MSPEYGATCGFFPVDEETLRYLRLTGRSAERIALVEAYYKENALWHDPDEQATYSQVVELDLSTVEPSLAGPARPQDRVPLRDAKQAFVDTLPSFGVDYGNAHDAAVAETFPRAIRSPRRLRARAGQPTPPSHGTSDRAGRAIGGRCDVRGRDLPARPRRRRDRSDHLVHQHVNPMVMVAAGLLAKKAVERGLARKPWVKSSLAPGSRR